MSKHVGKSTKKTHIVVSKLPRNEDYLTNYDGYVVTTEHFDLANPVTKVDDIPDYEMYSQTIDSLNKRFGNRVLKASKSVTSLLKGSDHRLFSR